MSLNLEFKSFQFVAAPSQNRIVFRCIVCLIILFKHEKKFHFQTEHSFRNSFKGLAMQKFFIFYICVAVPCVILDTEAVLNTKLIAAKRFSRCKLQIHNILVLQWTVNKYLQKIMNWYLYYLGLSLIVIVGKKSCNSTDSHEVGICLTSWV